MPLALSSSITSIIAAVLGILVRLDQDDALFLVLEDFLDLGAELFLAHRQAVDEEPVAPVDGDHGLFLRFRLVGRVGREGQPDVGALLQERCHDHHDDEQHEHDVHQRRDVDVRLDATFCAADIH